MTFATGVNVVANLYLLGGLITVAGVFPLRLMRVEVPMSVYGFFRWTGWLAVGLLIGAITGDLL